MLETDYPNPDAPKHQDAYSAQGKRIAELRSKLVSGGVNERRKERTVNEWVFGPFVVVMTFLCVMHFGGLPAGIGVFWAAMFGGVAVAIYQDSIRWRLRRQLLAELVTIEDMRVVAPLLCYKDEGSYYNGSVRSVLLRWLPQLEHGKPPVLDDRERKALHDILLQLRAYDIPLILAALAALERTGTLDALPALKPLAQGKMAARSHPEVREAAKRCVMRLETCLAQIEQPQSLLRAGSAPDAALLRPAYGVNMADAQHLLRADSPR